MSIASEITRIYDNIQHAYDGVREKGGVVPLPVSKSFAEATDSEFLEIAQALQENRISVDDLNWNVGDVRNVNLAAFNSYSSPTTQKAQTAELIILHKNINGVCAGKQFTDGSIPSFIIGFKDNVAKSFYHDSSNAYQRSLLYKVEDNIYNALPADIKSACKQFTAVTGVYSGSTTRTDARYMCSPAERELFGNSAGYDNDGYCIMAEYNALGSNAQFDYYKNGGNTARKHTNIYTSWWERSPIGSDNGACYVNSLGGSDRIFVYNDYGISPYCCI